MSKTVLIVEDYADVRAIMKFLVRRYGYEVIEARDGYEAILKTKEFSPDLILMDLAMPVMDGVTATKIIRELRDYAELPIIALSAYGDSWRNEAIQAGINQVVCKPLDFNSLRPLLIQYLH
jgi:CheY-like chemotaxis protein